MTLREYLDAEKLSQQDFAERARVPASQVSLWLSGARRPGLENTEKVRTATDGKVTAADWLGTKPARRPRAPRSRGRRPAPRRVAAHVVPGA